MTEIARWDLNLRPLAKTHQLLTDAAAAAHRRGRNGALLFCDLDGFNRVNDTYGHAAGDGVLIVIAQRLAAAFRRHDTVARLGGDEFVVVVEDTTSLAPPPRCLESLRKNSRH